jgi:hypothetical protein
MGRRWIWTGTAVFALGILGVVLAGRSSGYWIFVIAGLLLWALALVSHWRRGLQG